MCFRPLSYGRSFFVLALLTTFAILAASPLARADPLASPAPASAPTQHPSRQPAMLIAGVVLAVAGTATLVGLSVVAASDNRKNQNFSCSSNPDACPSTPNFDISAKAWGEIAAFCLGTASLVTGVPLIVVGARRLAARAPSVADPPPNVSWFAPSPVTLGARGPELTLTVAW